MGRNTANQGPLRGLAMGVLVCVAAAACGQKTMPTAPSTPGSGTPTGSLARSAAMFGKLVGTAVQSGFLGDAVYTSVLNRDFNYVTAEYEMKWDPIERTQGVNNFSGGDAIVSYAQAHGMQVKGHTLLWHGAVPAWVTGLSPADLKTAVDNHIRAVAQHFRGKVLAWDVVNEAVADDGSGLRNTIFLQGLGASYIADAFQLAHASDPTALLFYNDYSGEGLGAKSDAIYNLVKGLREGGVPIDGVGLQMHISANSRPPDPSIQSNMRRLADLGLLVNISEMDVKINGVSGSETTRLDAQRATYHAVVADCVMEPKCQAVTFWGFTDAHTWISGDQPLLYDTAYAAKPAYYGVADALSGQ